MTWSILVRTLRPGHQLLIRYVAETWPNSSPFACLVLPYTILMIVFTGSIPPDIVCFLYNALLRNCCRLSPISSFSNEKKKLDVVEGGVELLIHSTRQTRLVCDRFVRLFALASYFLFRSPLLDGSKLI